MELNIHLFLFRRLQPGRSQPVADVRAGLGLSGFAKEDFALRAVREPLGFLSQSLGFLAETFFEGDGLFKPAAFRHDWPRAYGS